MFVQELLPSQTNICSMQRHQPAIWALSRISSHMPVVLEILRTSTRQFASEPVGPTSSSSSSPPIESGTNPTTSSVGSTSTSSTVPGSKATPEVPETYYGKLKKGLTKYGWTGVATYFVISSGVTTGFYFAIENNLDVGQLLGIQKSGLVSAGSNFALAVICSKMMIPLKMPIAAFVTPYVFRLQERLLKRVVKTQ